jgi:hypothetical protein
MVKNITIKIALITVLFSTAGCKKFLDLKPPDGIIGADFWQTKEQVESAVIGCYASLLGSPNGARSLTEQLFLWGELRADMLQATSGATSSDIAIMNVNILPENDIVNWRSVYQTINYCNTVIAFAPGVLGRDNTFTQATLNRSLAEVKTLRALMYFYLVRSFGDVPLKIKATSTDSEIEPLAKSPADSVLLQIVKDLSEAEPDAVLTFGDQASDKGRITRFTVNAIQADVYLWMEKYADCVTACNKIINSGRFGLVDGSFFNNWFTTLYVNGNSNESIFEFQFDLQRQNPFYNMFAIANKRFLASPNVISDVFGVDPLGVEKDIRGDSASLRAVDNMIWKYSGLTTSASRPSNQYTAHWFVYRFADILLMKAEATNQLGNGQEALNLVAQVRNRAKAITITNLNPSPADKDGIANFILEERAREFAFEGKRWYDLLRNAKRNKYQNLNLLLSMVANTVPPDRQQASITKYKDKNSHYFPIYLYELQTNNLLVQNPFYK